MRLDDLGILDSQWLSRRAYPDQPRWRAEVGQPVLLAVRRVALT